MHIIGGTQQTGINSLVPCLVACNMDAICLGVDFDFSTNTCWFHNSTTECNSLTPKANCNHFRTQACAGTPTPSPTPVTTTPTPTTNTAQNFQSQTNGMHILGGTLIRTNVNLMQCQDACLMFPNCLAVDYNAGDQSCWAHFLSTYCGALVAKDNCTHYKRVPCNAVASRNVYQQTLNQFHKIGGANVCNGCTIASCLDTCAADTNCQGVDYDYRTMSCFSHDAATVCSPAVPKIFCNHYSKFFCAITTTPSPFAAPTLAPSTTVIFNFPSCSVLPISGAAYAGMNIPNSAFQQIFDNCDACRLACQNSAACRGFDYNVNNGGCWFQSTADYCNELGSAPAVYHAIKTPPLCVMDNAGNGYPLPTAINIIL
jgi:hypothetical protein